MTLRAADLRFLAPSPPRTAAILGGRTEEAEGFRAAGVEVVRAGATTEVDLVLGARRELRKARALRPRAAIVLGWPAVGAPSQNRRYLVTRGLDGPALAALEDGPVRRFLTGTWSTPTSHLGRARNRVVRHVGRGVANVAVSAPGGAVPYPLSAAQRALGLPLPTGWVLQFGRGDDLQRVVALAFAAGPAPTWVLKFSRVPGAPARGEFEQRVLAELEARAPAVAARATRVLGRLEIGGSDATVEPAAAGANMSGYLRTAPARGRHVLADQVICWAIELTSATVSRAPSHRAGRRPLLEELVGVEPGLLARLDGAATVLAHNDLGTWNILTDGRSFTIVDWESASIAGMPLWDVAYLATDILCELHGPTADEERVRWCAALWREELAVSARLSGYLRRAARAAGVADGDLAPLVASCWLHHRSSQQRRRRQLGRSAAAGYLGCFGARWSQDPTLGNAWRGFGAP